MNPSPLKAVWQPSMLIPRSTDHTSLTQSHESHRGEIQSAIQVIPSAKQTNPFPSPLYLLDSQVLSLVLNWDSKTTPLSSDTDC